MTPQQGGWMTTLGNFLMPMVGQQGPSFGGQRVASSSPLQTGAFNLAGAQGMQSTRDLLNGTWMSPLRSQAENLWNRTIMPSIMNQQASMDEAGSGGTIDRLAMAGQDMSTQLAAQLAPLSLNASQIGMSNLASLLGFGGQQQQQSQNELQALQQAWYEKQPLYNPVLSQLPMLFGQQAENIASQKPGGMGYSMATSGLGSLLGTEAGAGALMTSLGLSDERLKENIRPIESVLDKVRKLRAYRYNFKDSPKERIGMIAQRIEEVFPEAVSEDENGWKRVDAYALVSIAIQAISEMAQTEG